MSPAPDTAKGHRRSRMSGELIPIIQIIGSAA